MFENYQCKFIYKNLYKLNMYVSNAISLKDYIKN